MTRMPVPAYIGKNAHYVRLFHTEASDAPAGGAIAGAVLFGASAVVLSILFNLLFLLLLIPPAIHGSRLLSYMKNSTNLYSGHLSTGYGEKERGYYSLALEKYDKIYDGDIESRAMILVQSIWDHESALNKVGKNHRTDRYDEDCDICATRVDLLNQLINTQTVPGTLTDDVERITHFLEGKKDVKEIEERSDVR